jgi:hypothetical protein
MFNNWYKTHNDVNERRQNLLAEANQNRLVRLAQSAQPRLNVSFVRRVMLRLKPNSRAMQPSMKRQPAA